MRAIRPCLVAGMLPALLTLLVAPAPVLAQTSASASYRATPAAVLKSSLRSVVAAQKRTPTWIARRGKWCASQRSIRGSLW